MAVYKGLEPFSSGRQPEIITRIPIDRMFLSSKMEPVA